jgi:hypothetical protein
VESHYPDFIEPSKVLRTNHAEGWLALRRIAAERAPSKTSPRKALPFDALQIGLPGSYYERDPASVTSSKQVDNVTETSTTAHADKKQKMNGKQQGMQKRRDLPTSMGPFP